MWHLKTKCGVFWVLPVRDMKRYLLGINDQELSFYSDGEEAAQAVRRQCTGFLKWDMESDLNAPEHIQDWVEGEPQQWKKPTN